MRAWLAGFVAAVVIGRPVAPPQSPSAEPLAAIRLAVVDAATGKPVSCVEVTARVPGSEPRAAFNSAPGPYAPIPEGVSDLRGEVFLAGVPALRVCVEANKAGYEPSACTPPDVDESRTLTLTPGEVREHVVIHLVKIGGVTGRVTDETGEPVVGVAVTAFRARWGARGRTYVAAGAARTDDTGGYRINGLSAGSYLVGLQPHFVEAPVSDAPAMDDPIDEDQPREDLPIQKGFDIGGHRVVSTDPWWPAIADDGGAQPDLAYGPAFAPGVAAKDAAVISLARGEWKSDIDIELRPTKFLRVSVRMAVPVGVSLRQGNIFLTPADPGDREVFGEAYSAAVDSSGRFVFPFLRAGTYELFARATPVTSNTASVQSTIPQFSARMRIIVDERPQPILVSVEPDGPIAGRVIVDSGPPLPERFRGFNVMFTGLEAEMNVVTTVFTQPDGSFSIDHLPPSIYSLQLFGATGLALSSVVADGRDVTDALFHRAPGAGATELVLHVTDKLPSIAGNVDSAETTADTTAWVVIFSADRSFWTARSRRVVAQHPSAAGAFEFKSLPAGSYLMAVAHLEAESWRDPDVLASLVASATPITVTEGDHAVVRLASKKR